MLKKNMRSTICTRQKPHFTYKFSSNTQKNSFLTAYEPIFEKWYFSGQIGFLKFLVHGPLTSCKESLKIQKNVWSELRRKNEVTDRLIDVTPWKNSIHPSVEVNF